MSRVVEHMQFKGVGAAIVFGTTTQPVDLRWASNIGINISGLTAETFQLQVSYDQGVTWSAGLRPHDGATGALAGASAMGNGTFMFPNFPGGWVKLVKSAGAEVATVSLNARS